jgi:hypothetical protein
MDMWEWQAGERCTGVSHDADRAIEAAESALGVGEIARVERVRAFLSFHTLSSFYAHTGEGWTATRTAKGPVAWQRFPCLQGHGAYRGPCNGTARLYQFGWIRGRRTRRTARAGR